MGAERTLRELGLVLPAPPPAAGNYIGGVQVGSMISIRPWRDCGDG